MKMEDNICKYCEYPIMGSGEGPYCCDMCKKLDHSGNQAVIDKLGDKVNEL